LPVGEYRIFSQKIGEKADASFPTENLGAVEVQNGKQADVTRKLQSKPELFNVRSVGFNAQLSDLAVPIEAGKSVMIYLGGKSFNPDEMTVVFNSPYISVVPANLVKQDYGADVSVVRFEVKVGGNTPSGDYGIYIKYRGGKTESLPGSIVVENPENVEKANNLLANE